MFLKYTNKKQRADDCRLLAADFILYIIDLEIHRSIA